MNTLPTLKTNRLVLRPFTLDDAPLVQKYAGDKAIARMTANIPHPYEDGLAEEWIAAHQDAFEKRKDLTLAAALDAGKTLVGAISLHSNEIHRYAELGYWIGKPYWNQGYCTEAAKEIVRYGFECMNLNRIQARHMTHNPASGRVMEKIGMKKEGVLRQSFFRFGDFNDYAIWSILREEFSEK